MAKLKIILQVLLAICLAFGMNPGSRPAMALKSESSSSFVTSGDYNPDWRIGQEIPESYEFLGENANFQLYANRLSLAFKVVDKRSGYIWHSNLDEKISGDRLNKTWTAFASSAISIDYLDAKAISERCVHHQL